MNRSFRAQDSLMPSIRPRVPQLRSMKSTTTTREKEDDLALFLEMRKREKEKNDLLLDNSEELDETLALQPGNSPLFNVSSSVPPRKPGAEDFLNSDSDKNDYDWLLTPPGTPLFPSLEMESTKTYLGETDVPKARPTALQSRLANSQSEVSMRSNLPSSSPSLSSSSTGMRRPSSSGGPGSRPGTPTGRLSATTSSRPSRPSTPTGRSTLPSTRPSIPSTRSTPTSRSGTPTRSSVSTSAVRSTVAPRSSTPTRSSVATGATRSTAAPRSSTPTRSSISTGPTRSAAAPRSSTPTRSTVPSTSTRTTAAPRSATPTRSTARTSTPTSRPSIPTSRPTSRASTPTRRPSTPSNVPTGASALLSKSSSSINKPGPSGSTQLKNHMPSHGTSPTIKSRPWKPSEMPGFSLDAPPNLRTTLPDRPLSATRGRPGAPTARSSSVEPVANGRQRRQSCSPSRGRAPNGGRHISGSSVPAVNRGHSRVNEEVSPVVVGTKMVERVINMRRLAPPRQDEKHSPSLSGKSASSPDSSGFGRSLSKKSLDMAIRHMDIRRTIPGNLRPLMTNIPASSMYSVRSGPTRSRTASVSDSPLATSSNASSEFSVNNHVVAVDGSEPEDDHSCERGERTPVSGLQGR